MRAFKQFLTLMLISWMTLSAKTYQHNVQLQLTNANSVPIDNTEFWITLNVVKSGNQITINFPTINFQVGPESGYLITNNGFLPPDWRPNSLLPVAVLASSGDGLAQTFSSSAPTPLAGYIILISNAGEVIIQQAGSSQNAIPSGPHIVLPSSISYSASKIDNLCFNFQISNGFINVNEFPGNDPYTAAGDNIRDTHLNDAFENTFAWAWTDNHNVSYSDTILNVFVAIGKIDSKGQFKMGKPIQITNFPPNTIAWDTSIAINRQNKNNIVVSYGLITYEGGIPIIIQNCRAISFDRGKTWGGVFDGINTLPYNGLINYQTVDGGGDIPGVRADRFGNFWYGSTNENGKNIPYLLLSTDQGVTWTKVFEFSSAVSGSYDFPHLVFSQNNEGQYGVWYYADYFDLSNNIYPVLAFLPITGFGTYGIATTTFLKAFPNSVETPSITASNDGRFWAMGQSSSSSFYYNFPLVALYKSPGAIDQNYAGPWLVGSQNQINTVARHIFEFSSVPFFGYFYTVQELLYDDARQALYAIFSTNSPSLSQNMPLVFAISRNNGLTWSEPYNVSTTTKANRGFSSMALDKGNLYLGWYDGRNDSTLQKLQYFGGVIPVQKLDQLVNQIPLSNPTYHITGQGSDTSPP